MATVNTGASGLDNLLQSILSVALQEQNNVYPPFIYQSQYNVVTSLLISKLVREYPDNPQVLDMLDPFVKYCLLTPKSGYITLPSDYRNLIGSPFIFINKSESGECGEVIPEITNQNEFNAAVMKGQCKAKSVSLISESEFAYRTDSAYKFPTHKDPIACFFGNKQVKICPFDIGRVFFMYARNEKKLVYPYILQPDDTYIFNPTDPSLQDSEWTNAAFEPIFSAMTSLFSAYTRDPELRDWSKMLHEEGIL